jgi:hypothetical protein
MFLSKKADDASLQTHGETGHSRAPMASVYRRTCAPGIGDAEVAVADAACRGNVMCHQEFANRSTRYPGPIAVIICALESS